MLEVDGSEGGGQLLRSSLALAAVTGRRVRVTNVRADRPDPGLKPQHLTAVETVADICNATLDGATLDSETVTLDPGAPRGGQAEVDIGTAGSVTLLFDAVLPLAAALEQPVTVTATGGTEVQWSPPLATYRAVTLRLCRRAGLVAAVERHRTGFYPAGGGRATVRLVPSDPAPVRLTDRGPLVGAHLHSRASDDLASQGVAGRQAGTARAALQAAAVPVVEETTTTADTPSTGSALTVVLEYEHSRAGFDALGEQGTSATAVANEAVDRALAFHAGAAAVDRHSADQLLVALALGGGAVRIPEVTAHVASSLDLLAEFGFDLTLDDSGPTPVVSSSGDSVSIR